MTVAPALVSLVAASSSSSKSSSGSSSATLLIFIAVGAAFYFLFFRPQQRKAKALREQSKTFDVGDEVLTAGGLVGHVLDIDGDRVTLETSVGASFVVLKQYVVRRLEPPAPLSEDEDHDLEPEDHAEEDDHEGADVHDEEVEGAPEEDMEAGAEDGTVDVSTAGPSANGSHPLDEPADDRVGTDRWDQTPTASDDPDASSRRRSGRRKRRAPGGASGGASSGPGGPDTPTSR